MLAIASRPYTDAEFDEYAERMATGRAYSFSVIVLSGAIAGAAVTLGAYAAHWLYAWWVASSVTWTFSLSVGGVAAVVTSVGLWILGSDDDWTKQPPELAIDVTASAYAAWRTESDGLDVVYVLRVEAGRYLLITENALTPPLLKAQAAGAETIPSGIRLVLLGEGAFRVAMAVSFSGPAIPLARVNANPTDTDPDRFDETPIPDGLYVTDELPARIRRAIGVA